MTYEEFLQQIGVAGEPGSVLALAEALATETSSRYSENGIEALRGTAYRDIAENTSDLRKSLGIIKTNLNVASEERARALDFQQEQAELDFEINKNARRLVPVIARRLDAEFLPGQSEEDQTTARNSLFGAAVKERQIADERNKITDAEFLSDEGQAKIRALDAIERQFQDNTARRLESAGLTSQQFEEYKRGIQFDELYTNRNESNFDFGRFVRNGAAGVIEFGGSLVNLGLSAADAIVPGDVLSEAGAAVGNAADAAGRAVDDNTPANLLAGIRTNDTLNAFRNGEITRAQFLTQLAGDQSLESIGGAATDVAAALLTGQPIARGLAAAGGRVGQALNRGGFAPVLAGQSAEFQDSAADVGDDNRTEQAIATILGTAGLSLAGNAAGRLGLGTIEGAVGSRGLRGALGGSAPLTRRVGPNGVQGPSIGQRTGRLGSRIAGTTAGEFAQEGVEDILAQLVGQAGRDDISFLDPRSFERPDLAQTAAASVQGAILGSVFGAGNGIAGQGTESEAAALNRFAQDRGVVTRDAQAINDFTNDQGQRLQLLEEARVLEENRAGRQAFNDLRAQTTGQEINQFNAQLAQTPTVTPISIPEPGFTGDAVGPRQVASNTRLNRAFGEVVQPGIDAQIELEQAATDQQRVANAARQNQFSANADAFLTGQDASPIEQPGSFSQIASGVRNAFADTGGRFVDTGRAAPSTPAPSTPAAPPANQAQSIDLLQRQRTQVNQQLAASAITPVEAENEIRRIDALIADNQSQIRRQADINEALTPFNSNPLGGAIARGDVVDEGTLFGDNNQPTVPTGQVANATASEVETSVRNVNRQIAEAQAAAAPDADVAALSVPPDADAGATPVTVTPPPTPPSDSGGAAVTPTPEAEATARAERTRLGQLANSLTDRLAAATNTEEREAVENEAVGAGLVVTQGSRGDLVQIPAGTLDALNENIPRRTVAPPTTTTGTGVRQAQADIDRQRADILERNARGELSVDEAQIELGALDQAQAELDDNGVIEADGPTVVNTEQTNNVTDPAAPETSALQDVRDRGIVGGGTEVDVNRQILEEALPVNSTELIFPGGRRRVVGGFRNTEGTLANVQVTSTDGLTTTVTQLVGLNQNNPIFQPGGRFERTRNEIEAAGTEQTAEQRQAAVDARAASEAARQQAENTSKTGAEAAAEAKVREAGAEPNSEISDTDSAQAAAAKLELQQAQNDAANQPSETERFADSPLVRDMLDNTPSIASLTQRRNTLDAAKVAHNEAIALVESNNTSENQAIVDQAKENLDALVFGYNTVLERFNDEGNAAGQPVLDSEQFLIEYRTGGQDRDALGDALLKEETDIQNDGSVASEPPTVDPNGEVREIKLPSKGKNITIDPDAKTNQNDPFYDDVEAREFVMFKRDGKYNIGLKGVPDADQVPILSRDGESIVPDSYQAPRSKRNQSLSSLTAFKSWLNSNEPSANTARALLWEDAGKKLKGESSPQSDVDSLREGDSTQTPDGNRDLTRIFSALNQSEASRRRSQRDELVALNAQARELGTTPQPSQGPGRSRQQTAQDRADSGGRGRGRRGSVVTSRLNEVTEPNNDANDDARTETLDLNDRFIDDANDSDINAEPIIDPATDEQIADLQREAIAENGNTGIANELGFGPAPLSTGYDQLDSQEVYDLEAISESFGTDRIIYGGGNQRRSDFVPTPVSMTEARRVTKEFFGNGAALRNVEFMRLEDVNPEFADYIQQSSGEPIDYRTKMFVSDGKLYIFPEHIGSNNDLRIYLTHEILGHVGLRERYGPRLNGILDELYLSLGGYAGVLDRDADIGAGLRKNYPLTVQAAQQGDKQAQRNLTEELLAHLAEKATLDLERPQLSILKRAAIQVRRWLRQRLPSTLNSMFDWTVSDAELLYLVSEANHAGRKIFDSEAPLNTPRALQVRSVDATFSDGWRKTIAKGRTWHKDNSSLIGKVLALLGFDSTTTPGDAWANLNFDIKRSARNFKRNPENWYNKTKTAIVHDRTNLHNEFGNIKDWWNAERNQNALTRVLNVLNAPPTGTVQRVRKGKGTEARQKDYDHLTKNMYDWLGGRNQTTEELVRRFKTFASLDLHETLDNSAAATRMKRDTQELFGRMEDHFKRIEGAIPGKYKNAKASHQAFDVYMEMTGAKERNHGFFMDTNKNRDFWYGKKPNKEGIGGQPAALEAAGIKIIEAARKRTNSTRATRALSMQDFRTIEQAAIKKYTKAEFKTPLAEFDGRSQFEEAYESFRSAGPYTNKMADAKLSELNVVPGRQGYNKALHEALIAANVDAQALNDVALRERQRTGQSQVEEIKAIQYYGWKNYSPRVGNWEKEREVTFDRGLRMSDSYQDSFQKATGRETEAIPPFAAIAHRVATSYHGNADEQMKRALLTFAVAMKNPDFAEIHGGRTLKGQNINFGDVQVFAVNRNTKEYRDGMRNADKDTFIVHAEPGQDINNVLDDPAELNKYASQDNSGTVYIMKYRKNSEVAKMVKGQRETSDIANYMRQNYPHLSRSASYFGQMHTTYNPNYPLVQLVRDTMASFWTVAADGGFPAARHYITNLLGQRKKLNKMAQYMYHIDQTGKESADIAAKLRNDPELKNFIEWHTIGSPVQFSQALSMDSAMEQYIRGFNNRALNQSLRGKVDQGDSIIRMATIMTDTIGRFAAYESQLDQGKSPEEAAAFAKNIANFERRGSSAAADLGSIGFMFFRPTVIGATQITDTLLESQYNTEAAAVAAGLGVMFFAMGAMMSPDDEEGNNLFLTQKPSTTHLRWFLTEDFSVQMPYSYNPFTALMASTVQVMYGMTGNQSAMATASNIFDVMANNVSPVSNNIPITNDQGEFDIGLLGAKFTDMATPTLFVPLVALGLNRNSFGNEISPWAGSLYGPGTLGETFNSTRGQVGGISEGISRALFNTFGFSPDVRRMDFLMTELASGPRNLANSILEWNRILTADDYTADWKRAAIGVGSFIGSPHNRTKSDYYRVRSILRSAQKDLKSLRDAGTYSEQQIAEIITNHYGEFITNDLETIKDSDSALRKLNTDIKAERISSLTGSAYRIDTIERLDAEVRRVMGRANNLLEGDY